MPVILLNWLLGLLFKAASVNCEKRTSLELSDAFTVNKSLTLTLLTFINCLHLISIDQQWKIQCVCWMLITYLDKKDSWFQVRQEKARHHSYFIKLLFLFFFFAHMPLKGDHKNHPGRWYQSSGQCVGGPGQDFCSSGLCLSERGHCGWAKAADTQISCCKI